MPEILGRGPLLSTDVITFIRLAIVLCSSTAFAHTRIKPGASLIPRSSSSGEKTAPCGSFPPSADSANRTTLKPGAKLTISWEETIQHTGHFRIAFSPDGINGFDSNILMDNIPDTQNGSTNYTDSTTYHQFSQVITVPTTLCETCALQVIQVMIDNHPQTPTNYYSCADIRISNTPGSATNAAGTTSTANDTGTATSANATPAIFPTSTPVPENPAQRAPDPPKNLKVTIKR